MMFASLCILFSNESCRMLATVCGVCRTVQSAVTFISSYLSFLLSPDNGNKQGKGCCKSLIPTCLCALLSVYSFFKRKKKKTPNSRLSFMYTSHVRPHRAPR
eukprot:TRINITY_DN7321_c0_g2_i1.p1 TRINITY_DN7321_c0_g2~~TRINITY_DN7321_c0_g2_i1.p1  ORF type:complete len:102 (+),score=4.35 TRINITY_DN7321_c0_g2_i1:53-358(+)